MHDFTPVGKEGNWRRFSKRRPIRERASPVGLFEAIRTRPNPSNRAGSSENPTADRWRGSGAAYLQQDCDSAAATVMSVPRDSIWANPSHTNGRPLLYGKARLADKSDARVRCDVDQPLRRGGSADHPTLRLRVSLGRRALQRVSAALNIGAEITSNGLRVDSRERSRSRDVRGGCSDTVPR
jgi:hypothetical protein